MKQTLLDLGIVMIGEIKGTYACVVPTSGGKDSQACLMMAVKEFGSENVLSLFCDTQHEHPITYDHVKKITTELNVNLITLCAGSVEQQCKKYKRFPSDVARFCTENLKIRPSKFFYRELAKIQGGFEVWIGVRSDESPARKKRYKFKISTELMPPNEFMKTFPKYLEKMGVMFRLPVLDWCKEEIFKFLNGAENPLYSHGFDRVGCFPCEAAGDEHKMRSYYFDETGLKHFKIAQEIEKISGYPSLSSKKYANQGPGCSLCCM